VALLSVAALASVVAWGFLVWAAISFGRAARGGDASRWAFLGIASVGAVACLFLALLLVTMVLRRVGILEDNRPHRH
jgi:L-asparagine transporter-like permease